MTTVERIQLTGDRDLGINPIEVHDVEIFRIDIVRYLNAQRKRKNIKVALTIKDEEPIY